MRRTLRIFGLAFLLLLYAAAAWAYNPGQRTIKLLGQTLNSDKHPVHLVVTQSIDMRDVLTPDAYNKLPEAQKRRVSRTEYNEKDGINAERATITDGEGKVIKDTVNFCRDGYWYAIDYLHQSYDRVPELPGMSEPFAETLIGWFNVRPQGGHDEAKGYDYDKMTKGGNTLCFYFEKDTENWVGYQSAYSAMFKVEEVSDVVDDAVFNLPPAAFKQVADPAMRNFANRLMERKNR